MSMDFQEKTNLNAYVMEDPRGTGLLSIFVSTSRDGYPKYARVNTLGGLTYIAGRSVNKPVSTAPTLAVDRSEAQVVANAIMSFLYGSSWGVNTVEIGELRDAKEELERQGFEMRKAKKKLESDLAAVRTELAAARKELTELKDMRARYNDVMSVVNAVNSNASFAFVSERDC